MSISKRIKDQIEALDVNRNMKDLMLDILEAQSRGNKKAYDKKIQEYLDKQNKKGGEAWWAFRSIGCHL